MATFNHKATTIQEATGVDVNALEEKMRSIGDKFVSRGGFNVSEAMEDMLSQLTPDELALNSAFFMKSVLVDTNPMAQLLGQITLTGSEN